MSLGRAKEKYDNIAHYYDRRWEGYLEATNKAAIRLLEPSADDIILDASGGTGLLIEMIISKTKGEGKFYLTDISREMLEIAQGRLIKFKNVFISRQDVHNLDFADNYFSKILCVSALHYYLEPHRVLNNFHQMLRPNGKLIIVDWCSDSFHFKLFNIILKILSKYHVEIYSSDELESLLETSNFKVEKIINFTHGFWKLVGLRASKN
jgi:ubiquinone/menaquinone biosynthesis C-methylase UbiE